MLFSEIPNERKDNYPNHPTHSCISRRLDGHIRKAYLTGRPPVGVVPDDYDLVIATGKGEPIPSTAPSLAAFDAISKRLRGENAPLTVKIG